MKQSIPSFQLYYERELIAEIPINAVPFLIGRNANCHLRLIDNSISREHCRISVGDDGEVAVEDLSSTNGTLVNNTRIVRHVLTPSDVLTLGRCTLVFHRLERTRFEVGARTFWSRWFGRSNRPKFGRPR